MKKLLTILILLLTVVCNLEIKAEVVYTGSHVVESWNALQLPVGTYSTLAKAGAGDVIAVTISDVNDARISLQTTSYTSFNNGYDEYNCAAGIHYFALSESDAATIASSGLNVSGLNYTITKVELLYKKTLWSGTLNAEDNWQQSDALDNSLFSGFAEGSLLGITVSAINENEWHQASLRINYETNLIEQSFSAVGAKVTQLTSSQASSLTEATSVILVSSYLCISELNTYVENKYTLTVTQPANGSGTIQIGGVDAETANYIEGTQLTLTETPAANYAFSKWTIGSTDYTDNPYQLTITGNISVSATFTESGTPDQNVLWEGTSDLTSSNWDTYCTIDNDKALTLKAGDRITVTVSNGVIKANDSDPGTKWPSIQFYSNSTALSDKWNVYSDMNNGVTFPMTKDIYLSSSEIATIAENNNLKLNGGGCTLSKITYKAFDPVLWEGTSSEFNWKQEYVLSIGLAKDLVVGDTVRVTVASSSMTNTQYPTLRFSSKATNSTDTRKDEYNVVPLQSNAMYSGSDVLECPRVVDYVLNETDLAVINEENSLYLTGKGITISKVELIKYVEPDTKTLDVETVLYEGNTALTNWSQNYNQPTSVINSLQEYDVLKVTISGVTENSTNSQVRIAWGTAEGTYVSEGSIQNKSFPYDFTLTLTADQVTAIQSAGKLYLNGCNIIVSKWTLTQQKTVSNERGNAATTVWTGSEVVSWNSGEGNNSPLIAASAFANAAADMKVRVNFSSMKLGAQGRIIKSDNGTFDDVSIKKLPTECGDYFEYTITSDMLTELQANGMRINGVGYTATSVELIDPMKEYVINATFDNGDIIAWEPAQGTPNLTVTLTNYEEEEVTTTVSASLMTDMFVDYNNYSQNVTLAAGETKTVDLEFPDLVPGFYRMAAKANNNMLCTYYIGYNPTAIVSPDDSQADFATFWGTWKERLAEIPIDAELTLLEGEEGDTRNIYEVKYKSVPETVGGEPVYIYGYYAEPKAEGTYPCIIHFHGTDKSGSLTKPSGTTEGWCEFRFSARGQTLDKAKNGSEKYRTNPSDESSVDFYAYELGDNDKHYYRYVYLDTRRAVDFVCSKAKVNKNAIFAAGGSQGGCLTYVCAALSDGKIRAIAPSITGHADFVHTMEIVGWPTNVFNNWINAKVEAGTYANYEAGKTELLAHQSYFDTKNFAKWITCPVITNFSLQDNTDGPHLNIAPYNLLTNVAAADKQYSINQFKGHATADNWSTTYMTFFQNYITAAVPVAVTTSNTTDNDELPFAIGSSWNDYVSVAATQFANAKSGDKITINFSSVASGAQLQLKDMSDGWPAIESSVALETTAENYVYTLTATSAAQLKAAGLVVGGINYTISSITYESVEGAPTYYTLTITQPATAEGSITIYPTSSDGKYENGAQVKLTANALTGYKFSKWSDNSTTNPYTITMNANKEISVTIVESDPNVLWEGSTAIDWGNSGSQTVAYNGTTPALNIGDKLVFTIVPTVENIDWPQIQLNSRASGGPVLMHASNTAITSTTEEVTYIMTSGMIDDITTNSGLVVNGIGFTLTSVKVVAMNNSDGYDNSIWIGEKVFGNDWGTYQTVDKSWLPGAVAGDIIRLRVKDVNAGSQASFSYTIWDPTANNGAGGKTWSSLTSSSVDGTSVTLRLTEDMLTKITTDTDGTHTGLGNLHISGVNFTLTAIDFIKASTIKELTSTVSVTGDDWVWTSAENPQFTVNVANDHDEAVEANVTLVVTTDKYVAFKTLNTSKSIAANSNEDITFTLEGENKPTIAGFYRATIVVNDETVRAFYFGYAPTEISSPADKQSDFDTFWSTAKTQLAAIEATDEPVLTEITSKSTAARKVYLVEFKSVADGTSGDGVTVRGYYCEPTDGEKHPVIMHYLGYDSGYAPGGQSGAPYCPSGDANPNYAEFYLSTRGQSINNRPAADRTDGINKDFSNTYGDWFAYNFGNKDSWYYRGAFMDCVRAIDFMATRSTSDMDNLFAEGQSQGGALTYAAAALSGRTFKAIAPAITFMGDFPDYFEISSWPASVARANQGTMTDAEMFAFLSYFDTKNLAPQVNCPVITSIGVQDNVCPPHTNIAPYNNLPSSVTKQIVYNPELMHATNSDWYTTYMNFFKNYETAAPSNRVDRTMLEKSLDIADGDIELDKVLFKNAVSGDVIKIYANLSTGAKIALEPSDYSGALDGANWPDFTESPFTLKLTSAALTKIKEKGLLIRGEKFTFTKAVLYTENELGEVEGDDDDEEKIIDTETGEADLTELAAQDGTKTTLTQNEDGSITMTTTEAYAAAQIWFNNPEPVAGNVLKVDLAESKVNVTVTVQYTDGTQSQMSANTTGVAAARAATRSDSGTTIEVPLETGKEVQNIEVKNNVAGTITIKKMQVTTVNVFTNGVANLSMLKPQSNATYDTAAHTLATTKGWTGATISPVANENVSGKELLIEFADASKVKVAVKYRTDVEGPSTIMEKAAKAVRLALDNTKNIQEISIQPTEAAIVTFTKIAVNSEETDDGSLKPGKTITLWENAAGETLAWNEVAKQDASVGETLKEYDELLITVSGVTKGCDWPKVFIRDASSEQAGNEVLLNDIGSFPYTVRIVLTGEMAQQLSKGFSICGDGVTVTKLQVYRPEAPKPGDIHLADLNYGYNSSYDKGTHTITTTARWAARGWEIGDKRYNDKNLITVKFEPVDFPVTLKMEYTTGLQTAQATSVGVPAGRTELLLEVPSGISKLNRVYIIYENPGSVKLTEASVTYQDNLKLSTAIRSFEADGVIRDGRYDTDGWYNLRGMRIPEPKTSGVYIHGGKKVVIY